MSLQSNDQERTTTLIQPAAPHHSNGTVEDAQHDPDVASLVSAEVDKRVAELHRMTSEAAYYRAQRRGFAAGHELEDWSAAEADVIERLRS